MIIKGEYDISTITALEVCCRDILEQSRSLRVYTLEGDLGAGKTTFVQSMARLIGVEEEVTSPTFPIIQEYGRGDRSIVHFDLYRLSDAQDLVEIGFEDYIESHHYVFIEWPELAYPFLDQYNLLRMQLEHDRRTLSFFQKA